MVTLYKWILTAPTTVDDKDNLLPVLVSCLFDHEIGRKKEATIKSTMRLFFLLVLCYAIKIIVEKIFIVIYF